MEESKQEIGIVGEDILVIEDSPTQAIHLKHLLEKHGHRVSTAGNGREALTLLTGEKPGLIISDILMPELDGYELCRIIKANQSYRDIPVILLTSLADPKDVIKGLECGADNFITKPYSEEHLLARIEHTRIIRNATETADMEICFAGRKYLISAGRRQILNLLLSTYEAAIGKNHELIRARDELKDLNAKLAATNRELEAFNYTVSHDLRSPLTGIAGYCQLLMEACAGRLDEQCAGYIRGIAKSAHRMDQLITTILRFSRITSSNLHRETVNLSQISRAIAAQLRLNEPQRRVTFNIAEGALVSGDTRLLKVVMDNLLGNAWKYTGKQDEATIEFGGTQRNGKQVWYVRDNGPGFDMKLADRLFIPFQRLHDSEEFEGHGIGLATVLRIIERHGGRVWAEGEPGKGAAFFFILPGTPNQEERPLAAT